MCIINNSYKFVFVHVPKAAGTSLTNALSTLTNYCDLEIGGTSFGEKIQPAYRDRFGLSKHSTAAQLRALMGAANWSRYYSFGYVRNPFARCLSTYNFLRAWEGGTDAFFARMRAFRSFEEYVLSDEWELGDGPDQIFRAQTYWLRDPRTSQIIVSYVGKVETFKDDLRRIFEVAGIPSHHFPRLEPRLNQSQGEEALPANPEVIDRILSKYKIDFDLFGYSHDPIKINAPV